MTATVIDTSPPSRPPKGRGGRASPAAAATPAAAAAVPNSPDAGGGSPTSRGRGRSPGSSSAGRGRGAPVLSLAESVYHRPERLPSSSGEAGATAASASEAAPIKAAAAQTEDARDGDVDGADAREPSSQPTSRMPSESTLSRTSSSSSDWGRPLAIEDGTARYTDEWDRPESSGGGSDDAEHAEHSEQAEHAEPQPPPEKTSPPRLAPSEQQQQQQRQQQGNKQRGLLPMPPSSPPRVSFMPGPVAALSGRAQPHPPVTAPTSAPVPVLHPDVLIVLPSEWVVYLDKRTYTRHTRDIGKQNYEGGVQRMATIRTIGDFWGVFNNIKKPYQFPLGVTIKLFRDGIRPMWEDPANLDGGTFIFSVTQNDAGYQRWFLLVLEVVSGVLDGNEVNGLEYKRREHDDRVLVWNRHAHDGKHVLNDRLAKLFAQKPRYDVNKDNIAQS